MKLLLANVIVSLLLPEVSLAQTDRAGQTAQNLRTLNESVCAIFQKGHVPIIGVNLALPIIESAGQDAYQTIMMPLALRLTERCDAVLRIEGVSRGADDEVETFLARGLAVFRSVDEIPSAHSNAG
jgi:hypothetical protein